MGQESYIWQSKEPSFSAFKEGLAFILSKPIRSLIILSCSTNKYPLSDVNSALASVSIPICGGCYPNVFLENELLESGVLFIGLTFNISIELFPHLENDVDKLASRIEENKILMKAKSAFMFYDGLMENAELFIEELHSIIDHSLPIVGGGAGDLDFIQRPCVYTNDGLKSDVIQMVILPKLLSTSVGHGWQMLEGPFLVSESEGANIESLNYQSAFSVYQETVENLSNYTFTDHNFFDIAKHFPLGIESVQGDLLVRDPIVMTDGSILCVGNVPINSMVYILKGEKSLLIDSAAKALDSVNKIEDCALVVIFDCISRKLYLEDSFEEELDLLTGSKRGPCFFGVLSLGEIANDKSGSIKLLNKSTVIGCL